MPPSRRRFLRRAAGLGLAAPLAGLAARSAVATAAATGAQALPPLPSTRHDDVVLAFVGDFFLTQPLPERVDLATEQVFDTMHRADAAFANLENGLSTVGSPELGGYRWGSALRGHPSLVREVARVGLDAVSTANNHTCNYGREALLETLATLDGAWLRHAGSGRTVDDAFRPTMVEAKGLTVAFFSLYCCHYNRVSQEVATDTLPGVACARAYDVLLEVPGWFEERNVPPNIFPLRVNPAVSVMAPLREDVVRLTDAIRQGRANADLAVLSVHFHWARHTKPDLPYHQRVIAHAAIDAGIDLFVGHGPHTLRGVELYRDRPVLFSIGNFILPPRRPGAASEAAVPPPAHQSVVVRAVADGRRVTRLEFLPIAIGDDGLPRFAGQEVGRIIVNRLIGLSAEFGTEIAPRGWYGALDLQGASTAARASR